MKKPDGKMKKGTAMVLLGALASQASGQDVALGDHAAAIENCSGFVTLIQEENGPPGLAVAVGIDGEIVWAAGRGFADVERRVPATPDTLFRIGSVSKVLTASAVALLHEQGQLDLEAPVQRYVPEFPDKGHTITTIQLAGHLAGVRHYSEEEMRTRSPGERHYGDVVAALHLFKDDPLVRSPGEEYAYSSYAWALISAVVQRAGQQPFLEYMHESVFEPLGMKSTRADDLTQNIPGKATPYDGDEVAQTFDLSYCWGGAGFLSTAKDLVRYGSAHLPGSDFLEPSTLEVLFANQKTNDGETVPHGIGWFVDELTDGHPVYYHGGEVLGGRAILLVRPHGRIVVALLGNRTSPFGPVEANRIADEFLNKRTVMVRLMKDRTESAENKAELVGLIRTWIDGVARGDLVTLLETVSEHFEGKLWNSKEALARHLRNAFDSGATRVNAENTHLQTRGRSIGAYSYFSGMEIQGPVHEGPLTLVLRLEKSGWKVVDLVSEPRRR